MLGIYLFLPSNGRSILHTFGVLLSNGRSRSSELRHSLLFPPCLRVAYRDGVTKLLLLIVSGACASDTNMVNDPRNGLGRTRTIGGTMQHDIAPPVPSSENQNYYMELLGEKDKPSSLPSLAAERPYILGLKGLRKVRTQTPPLGDSWTSLMLRCRFFGAS